MPNYPKQVIDIHTHIFNTHYIPLKGVLQGKGVPGWLAVPLSKLLNLLTGKTDHEHEEQDFVTRINSTYDIEELGGILVDVAAAELALRFSAKQILPEGKRSLFENTAKLEGLLRSDELYSVLEELEGLYRADQFKRSKIQPYQIGEVRKFITSLHLIDLSDTQTTNEVTKDYFFDRFIGTLRWVLKKLNLYLLADEYGAVRDYLKFFLLMLSKEETMISNLVSGYRIEQNVGPILHLMMDMQKGFSDEEPYFSFPEQIYRMKEIVESARGKFFGFVGFDPRRENSLKIIKSTLGKENVGIKIYPPLGYRPFEEQYQKQFEELYGYCCKKNIPVMTHCTPVGFESHAGAGAFSDPDNWENVLTQFPKLKLCYGHAGGAGTKNIELASGKEVYFPGWCDDHSQWEDKRCFAQRVVVHCKKYLNVYCDVSYICPVIDDSEKAGLFKANFVRAYSKNGEFDFADKAMYGTDWHMPKMTRSTSNYLDFMVELFDSTPEITLHKEKFFYINALKYLDIKGTKDGVAK